MLRPCDSGERQLSGVAVGRAPGARAGAHGGGAATRVGECAEPCSGPAIQAGAARQLSGVAVGRAPGARAGAYLGQQRLA
jgi:hypothetical protein